ncbi:MAG: type II toxin-antitoxin system RelE family toxin [Streptosporangiaceae bacterium]
MALYEIELTARARKQYEALDRPVRDRIRSALASLAEDPDSAKVKALTGHDDLLRIRVGAWRVIYRVDRGRVLIIVIEIGHRSTVYRRR